MNRLHAIIIIAVLSILLAVGLSFWKFTSLDRAVNGALNNGTDLEFEPKYQPSFAQGVGFPTEVTTLAQLKSEHPQGGSELVKRYEALAYASQGKVYQLGCAVKRALATSTPQTWKVPALVDICAASPDLKTSRDFARSAGLIGRYLIAKGKVAEGVELLESVAYLAPAICLEHPDRVTLIVQMVAIALVGVAADGFILAASDLQPDRATASAIGVTLDHALSLLPPLSYSITLERRLIPSFPEAFRKQAAKKGGTAGSDRAEEFKRVADCAEPHLKVLFDSWIPFLDKPWQTGWPGLSKMEAANGEYLNKTLNVDGPLSYVKRVIRPYEAVAGIMLNITVPNAAGAYRGLWKMYQRVEGAKTVLALEAFRKEQKRFPATLEELAAWWKAPVGRDFFTGTLLKYDRKGPSLSSPGPDTLAGNRDDILFLPLEEMLKN